VLWLMRASGGGGGGFFRHMNLPASSSNSWTTRTQFLCPVASSSSTPAFCWSDDQLRGVRSRLQSITRQRLVESSPRRAAVLIPLCNHEGRASILFTRRAETVSTHRGQVAFPGGMTDETDTSEVETALRETEEEIGFDRRRIRVLGQHHDALSLHRIPVTPVVGFLESFQLNELRLSEREIDAVFVVPFSDLIDPLTQVDDVQTSRRAKVPMKMFTGPNSIRFPIWGLTAFFLKLALDEVILPALQQQESVPTTAKL